jgi:hypothetical protein
MKDRKVDQRCIELFDEFTHGTNAARYDENAADLARGRIVAFLRKNLG